MKDNKIYKYIKDYLKIIKRNIHRIFSYNKLFFFIFHGLQIMSLIALIYSYSHMRIENDNYQANIMMSSTYTVDFLQGVKYESISDKLNDINLDDVSAVITKYAGVNFKYKATDPAGTDSTGTINRYTNYSISDRTKGRLYITPAEIEIEVEYKIWFKYV